MGNIKKEIIKKYKITQSDLVLIAIFYVSNGTKEKVPFEEIAIRAWRDFPDSFSLKNHPEYPDGSAIPKRVADRLKPNGLVISLGDNFFRLTDKGIEKAQKLDNALRGISTSNRQTYRKLSREEENFIRHALFSTAFDLWNKKEKETIIDHEVKLFFQFSTGTKIRDRYIKVQFAKASFENAEKIGIANTSELLQLTNFLTDKFGYLIEEGKDG
jgi:hypothetical protein